VEEDLLRLLAPRKGHFRLESGHHGDLWLEIVRLYLRPRVLRQFASKLARQLAPHRPEAICGPLVEGALLSQIVAEELDVEFYFAEQFTRPPDDSLYPIGYRIPDVLRPIASGKRFAIVDDVINAGSAVRGACIDLRSCDAMPVVIGALLILGDPAESLAASEGVELESLAQMPNTLWEPSACPLCASRVPLEEPAVSSR
jgi:orotate phosphoribosyltransferase